MYLCSHPFMRACVCVFTERVLSLQFAYNSSIRRAQGWAFSRIPGVDWEPAEQTACHYLISIRSRNNVCRFHAAR